MKTLKYIAVLGIAGLLLGSCVKEQSMSDQNKGKAKPTVTITTVAAADGELTFTLAPSADASQYGYVIFSGSDNKAPDAYDIVIGEVGGVEDYDVFNYADDASIEVTFECDSHSAYQVFAAAITASGLPGEVAKLDVFVDDSVAPEIIFDEDEGYAFDYSGSVLYIQYSEPVKYVEGNDIVATLYAGYSYEDDNVSIYPGVKFTVIPYLTGTPVGTAKARVTVDGDVVAFDFGTMTPGTYYTLSIPDGAFTDLAGNEAEGYEGGFTYPYFYAGEPAFEWVIFGHTDNAALTVTMPTQTDIDDLSVWIQVGVPSMVQVVNSKAAFKTTIKHKETFADGSTSETVTTYPMAPVTHFGGSLLAVLVKPAGNPKPADEITITIPAGAVTDIYGNVNREIVVGPFKYAYTPVYPNEGLYSLTSVEGTEFEIELAALTDDPAGPYALYGDWFGVFGEQVYPILYLTLDEESRTLTCDGRHIYNGSLYDDLWGSAFYYIPNSGNRYIFSIWGGGATGTEPVVITYDDNGDLSTMSYFEYGVSYASNGSYDGWYDYVDDDTPIFKVEDDAPAAAASSVKSPATPADITLPQVRKSVRK